MVGFNGKENDDLQDEFMDVEKKNYHFSLCLIRQHTGEIIFKIPCSMDKEEKIGFFASQVFNLLIILSNKYNDYDKAIDEVQSLLLIFIRQSPEEYDTIKQGADQAGESFIHIVGDAKKRAIRNAIERGEMILNVKGIRYGNKSRNDSGNCYYGAS